MTFRTPSLETSFVFRCEFQPLLFSHVKSRTFLDFNIVISKITFIMFFILPILGAATVINCVPFFEDFNDVGSPEDLNVDPSDLTDFSSIPIDEGTKENDETGSDLDEVADVCASSLDNDDAIFRRQICTTKKSGQMVAPQSPEVPHEGVSLHPRFKMDIKSTSDPECVNFDSRPEYVVCGGPEGYTRDDLPLDSTSVFNCISGMTFSGWIPQGGWFKATNKVARYCCSVFTNQVS